MMLNTIHARIMGIAIVKIALSGIITYHLKADSKKDLKPIQSKKKNPIIKHINMFITKMTLPFVVLNRKKAWSKIKYNNHVPKMATSICFHKGTSSITRPLLAS